MNSGVVAALITAGISLVLTVGKIVWDAREKLQERRLAAREKLDRYRSPLLAAVDELGRHVQNVREGYFLAYLNTDDRREVALLTMQFRLAQYLGWTEIVYGYADRLRFERDEATRAVAARVAEVASILARDLYDRTNPAEFWTSQLMLWRDEQRAIGELMRQEGEEPHCMGFDSFVNNYDKGFAKWFGRFARELSVESVEHSERLALLHHELAHLARELDVDKLLRVEVPNTTSALAGAIPARAGLGGNPLMLTARKLH